MADTALNFKFEISKEIRALAFYLPQYHPIVENDQWWGKGFTEWRNVSKAKPLFKNHYQPHLPADLGFYDLRLPEAREAQAELARESGLYGFVYYHYWFNSKRLLERPFEEVLSSGNPDFPFCVCWANENWTRNWDGQKSNVLLGQNYSEEDSRKHIQWLAKAFRDERYIRVNGKPLVLIYRVSEIPNPLALSEIWRDECKKQGVGDIYLCRVESFPNENGDVKDIGFDASIEFAPRWYEMGSGQRKNIIWKILKKFGLSPKAYGQHHIHEYDDLVKAMLSEKQASFKRYPCVTPSWDNTARRKHKGFVLKNSTPDKYGEWLKNVSEKFQPYSEEENFVFINAWNEWAEGNHLEPCMKWGKSYIEATRKALQPFLGAPIERVKV